MIFRQGLFTKIGLLVDKYNSNQAPTLLSQISEQLARFFDCFPFRKVSLNPFPYNFSKEHEGLPSPRSSPLNSLKFLNYLKH